MAEVHIVWKVKVLREIINGPPNARFYPKPDTEEADWFEGMIADGYVTGNRGTELTQEDMRKMGLLRATGRRSSAVYMSQKREKRSFMILIADAKLRRISKN